MGKYNSLVILICVVKHYKFSVDVFFANILNYKIYPLGVFQQLEMRWEFCG